MADNSRVELCGDHDQLLGLLHPNGRRIVETLKQSGASGVGWTLILDECHTPTMPLSESPFVVRSVPGATGEQNMNQTPPTDDVAFAKGDYLVTMFVEGAGATPDLEGDLARAQWNKLP